LLPPLKVNQALLWTSFLLPPALTAGSNLVIGCCQAAGSYGENMLLSLLVAVVAIVDSCNLACPVCFADSPPGAAGATLQARPLEDLQARIEAVLARKGKIEILQLYLQYDGPQAAGQQALRGSDLRVLKELALARCEHERIPFTLAMTVTREKVG
jgi:uncharacterized radical SAM superfamily Fe-S cluster-containing enzyme